MYRLLRLFFLATSLVFLSKQNVTLQINFKVFYISGKNTFNITISAQAVDSIQVIYL